MQRFLRIIQAGLHLIQLQLGVDAFAFSLLLLAERFLCLGALFEELRAQALNELEGVIEQVSPVVERPRYYSAAAEEKVPFVVVGTGFKRCRQRVLVTSKTKQFPAIFDAPACCRRNSLELSWFCIWLSTPTSELLFYKARLIKC
jgi:hypothetical protein